MVRGCDQDFSPGVLGAVQTPGHSTKYLNNLSKTLQERAGGGLEAGVEDNVSDGGLAMEINTSWKHAKSPSFLDSLHLM